MTAVPLAAAELALCAATARVLAAAVRVATALSFVALASVSALALSASSSPAPAAAWTRALDVVPLALAWAFVLPERLLAFRLHLDAGLFADLARGRIGSLAALDTALQALFGARLGPVAGTRVLADRVRGAQGLVRRHAAVVAGQGLAALMYGAARLWGPA